VGDDELAEDQQQVPAKYNLQGMNTLIGDRASAA